MIKLYEGCWGVTRAGEKRGPIGHTTKDSLWRKTHIFSDPNGLTYRKDGSYSADIGVAMQNDIIAVFAAEPEADAYLAGEKPTEAPKLPEVGSSFDFRRQDGTWIKVSVVQDVPDPKPVTWPDGVVEMELEDGTTVRLTDGSLLFLGFEFTPEQARQLADLLRAAADYVDGGGK